MRAQSKIVSHLENVMKAIEERVQWTLCGHDPPNLNICVFLSGSTNCHSCFKLQCFYHIAESWNWKIVARWVLGSRRNGPLFYFEGQIVTDISYVSSVQIQYLRQGWEHRSRWWQPVGERGEQLIIVGRCRQKSEENIQDRVNVCRMQLRKNIFWSQPTTSWCIEDIWQTLQSKFMSAKQTRLHLALKMIFFWDH